MLMGGFEGKAYLPACEYYWGAEFGLGVVDEPFGCVVAVFWSSGEGMFGYDVRDLLQERVLAVIRLANFDLQYVYNR